MAESMATPRIAAQHLEAFQGKTVRLLGRITDIRGESATLDATGGQINILLNRDAHVQKGRAFEILGRVTPELSVRALAATDFGDDLDMKAVEAVIEATHKYSDLFYERS